MFEKLLLSDFQAHRKLAIKFDKRVTIIAGETDTGKSAIIRALTWVLLNTPNGDDFIRWGAKKAVARLLVDGKWVKRIRGKGRNVYRLDDKRFNSFGSAVPGPIADLLRVDENINVQRQHDGLYWFQDSASSISKKLNQIVDLSIIDDTLAHVASTLRKARSEVDICKDRLADARNEKKELFYAVAMDEELRHLESMQAKLDVVSDEASRLAETLEGAAEYEQLSGVEIPSTKELDSLKDEVAAVARQERALRILVDGFDSLTEDLNEMKTKHKQLHKEFHARYAGKTCPMCEGKGHL